MKKISISVIAVAAIVFVFSCTKTVQDAGYRRILSLPEQTPDYNDDLPDHMDDGGNPSIDNDLANLGRVLFYDEILSRNSRISCASCHLQDHAFSDGKKSSEGFAMGSTPRNSISFNNTYSKSAFFWDGRAETLIEQVVMPITNHIELGNSSIDEVLARVNSRDYYAPLVSEVTGEGQIDELTMARALSSFVNSIKTYKTPFDNALVAAGVDDFWSLPDMPAEIQEGLTVFIESGCANCHGGRDFGGWGEANIGLDTEYTDNGFGTWTNDPGMNGVFKVPSLRNVELTAPYMHDGRFNTLEEVVEHYNQNIKPHPNLHYLLTEEFGDFDFDLTEFIANGGDPALLLNADDITDLLITATPRRFNLTETQKAALIRFLKSLTDREFMSDQRFSDPFVVVPAE